MVMERQRSVNHECRKNSLHWVAVAVAAEEGLKRDFAHSLCDLKLPEHCNCHRTELGGQGKAGHNCKVGSHIHNRTVVPYLLPSPKQSCEL